MIYVPYSIPFVTEMDENHPVAREMIERAGEALPDVLAEMLTEFLDDTLAKMNEGWTFARAVTLQSIASEFMVKDIENYVQENVE